MNLELEKLSLIDILSEDDFLIDSQLRRDSFTGFRLSVAFENGHDMDRFKSKSFPAETHRSKVVNSADVFEHLKEDSAQDDKCNARKSLAWDSAFFTSAGVLDPDELSMINKGFTKTEMQVLPCISEELQGAADSRRTPFVGCSKSEVTPRNMRNARSRESNSAPILRSSCKLSGRSMPFPAATPSKRAGFGNARTASKKPCLETPCSIVTPGSTKSYYSGTSTVTSVTVSSSAYDKYENASSESTNKSIWNSFRRNKTRLESSSDSACKSLPKRSNCLSTASSTDQWSAGSVSSSSANKDEYKNSKEKVDFVNGKGGLFDVHATEDFKLESATPTSADVSSHLKASGLRLPSPKFGYFEMEESPAKTPNALIFHVQQDSSSKRGTETNNLSALSNRSMHAKFQAVRTVNGSQFRKLKQASSTVAITSRTKQTCPSMSSKSQPSSSPQLEPQTQFKKTKVVVPGNTRHVPVKTKKGLINCSGNKLNQAKKVQEQVNQQRRENHHHSSYAVGGKENTFSNKDQVDGLCKRFGSVDLSKDLVIGL